MNRFKYTFLLAALMVVFISCEEEETFIIPEVDALNVEDSELAHAGLARFSDIREYYTDTIIHRYIQYNMTLSSEALKMVRVEDKDFWETHKPISQLEMTNMKLWLVSPVVVPQGTADENFLGEGTERLFRMTDEGPGEPETSYRIIDGSYWMQNYSNLDDYFSYKVTGGTVKVTGTLPRLKLVFNLQMEASITKKRGTLEGELELDFQVLENR